MKKPLAIFLLVACAGAFVFGLVRLFQLRYEAGDVYPPYSSLRADPLGTMAFYESLQNLPGLNLHRDFSAANRLPEPQNTAYLHLAARPRDWQWAPEALASEIQNFVTDGGRLIVTFFPEPTKPLGFFASSSTNITAKAPPVSKPPPRPPGISPKKPSSDDPHFQEVSLTQHFGFDFAFIRLSKGEGDSYETVRVVNRTELPLPQSLEWHSGMVFTNLATSWHTVYARGTNPVVIERKLGSGSIVIASDSYFLSNEALLKARHADFLAWLLGPVHNVVFDESHFGIVEEPGIATLLRKYRLYGLGLGLMLLAGLFVWKNSVSFVPLDSETVELPYVAGRDAAGGFVNLLRRNIPQRDILKVCFAEWTKSLGQTGIHSISRVDAAQTIFEAESARPVLERNSVRSYRDICAALKGARPPSRSAKMAAPFQRIASKPAPLERKPGNNDSDISSVPDPPKPTTNS